MKNQQEKLSFGALDKEIRSCILDPDQFSKKTKIKPGQCLKLAGLLKQMRDDELHASKHASIEQYFNTLGVDRSTLFALLAIYERIIINPNMHWESFWDAVELSDDEYDVFLAVSDDLTAEQFLEEFLATRVGWAKLRELISLFKSSELREALEYDYYHGPIENHDWLDIPRWIAELSKTPKTKVGEKVLELASEFADFSRYLDYEFERKLERDRWFHDNLAIAIAQSRASLEERKQCIEREYTHCAYIHGPNFGFDVCGLKVDLRPIRRNRGLIQSYLAHGRAFCNSHRYLQFRQQKVKMCPICKGIGYLPDTFIDHREYGFQILTESEKDALCKLCRGVGEVLKNKKLR